MPISDLYPTGLHQQNLAHFASIVRIAMLDDKIDEKELKLLKRLAHRLDIPNHEYDAVLKKPNNYPMRSPVSYEERLEELYDLTKMLFIDRNPTIDKTSLLDRIAIGLGFHSRNIIAIRNAAIQFFLKEPDLDDFKEVIKKANPIQH